MLRIFICNTNLATRYILGVPDMLENCLFTSNQNGRNVSERTYSVTEKLKVMYCIQRLLIFFYLNRYKTGKTAEIYCKEVSFKIFYSTQ